MAEEVAGLQIRIETVGANQATRQLNDVDGAARRVGENVDRLPGAFDRASGSMRTAGASAAVFGKAYAALAAVLSIKQLVDVADAYTNLASRLNLATGSVQRAAVAQQQLFQIAQQTRNSFTATADVFARFATSTQQLGISQERLFNVTKTLNQAITLSGASAQSAQAAMIQLGQGIAAGTLRGEELNSVLEQTPAVARAIADGLGVPVGALRKLGEQGKLTAEMVIEALERVSGNVQKDFDQVQLTVGQAFTKLANSAGLFISEVDKATGATTALANAVNGIADGLDAQRPGVKAFFDGWAEAATNALELTAMLYGGGSDVTSARNSRIEREAAERERALREQQQAAREAFRRSEIQGVNAAARSALPAAETEEEKKVREKYEKLIAAIKSKIELEKQELALGRELTAAEKVRFDAIKQADEQSLTGARRERFIALSEELAKLTEYNAEAKAHAEAVKEMTEATERYNKEQQKRLEDVISATDKVKEETDAIILQTESIGKTKEEVQALIIAKEAKQIADLEEKASNAELEEGNLKLAKAYREQAEALRDRANARRRLGEAQQEQEIIDRQKKAFESLYNDLQRGLTDALFRGFEKGRGFLKSFTDAIKNAFKTLVIKLAIQPAIGSAIGGIASSLGFSGLAQAATKELGSFGGIGGASGGTSGGAAGSSGGGFGLSEAGGLKSIYDGIAGGVQGLSNGATVAGFKLSKLAGFADDTAASIGNFAGSATTAIAAAGIAYGGYQLGRGVSGGYSLNGGTGNGTVNVGATAGAIAGGIFTAGNPIGIAIGSAIGSIIGGTVNKLFGSKRVLGASGIQGEFADGQFTGQTFQDVTIKRKLRSSKSFTQFGDIDSQTLDLLSDSFQAITESAKASSKVLGRDLTQAIDRVRVAGRFQIGTQEQFKATLDRLSDEIIKQTIPAVERFREQGENLVQTAERIAKSVGTANEASNLLGKSALFTIDNAEAAMSLTLALGGSVNALESALSAFIPSSDLTLRQISIFDKTVLDLGLSSKITSATTREQFAALLEQIDLTSEAGQRELATLIQLAPSLDAIIKQREAENLAAAAAKETLDRLISSVSGTTNAFVDADKAINATRLALFNTTDVQTRLGLEAQLGQQIVARYELEMQLLGALQAGLSELQVNIGGERGSTQGAIANIVGTPLQMNAQQISQAISGAASLAQLPTLDRVSAAASSVAQRESTLAGVGNARLSLAGANTELNSSVAAAKSLVTQFNNLSQIGSAFATTGAGGRTSARFDETLRQIIRDEYAYVTYNVGDEGSVSRLFNEFNPVFNAVGGANQRISSAAGEVSRLQSIIASEPEALRALEASQRALAEAQKEFADGIQAFVIDAGRAVTRLSKLREETVKYFEAQKQLSDLMTASAQGIRGTIASIRFADLSPVDQLRNLQNQFAGAFAAAQGASGSALASAGDTLNSLIEPLLGKAAEVFASGAEFQSIRESVLSQAETIAAKLEELAPKNFQEESVMLLTQIDAQLAAIEQSASTAEKLIVDAINLSRDRTLDGLRGVVSAIRGEPVQAFANGGFFGGGMRLVGERGPELEVTGPSRIFSAQQTRNIMSGGADVAAEIRALRQDMAQTGSINLKIVTPDGRVMAEQTIREIKERSRKGELVIYADGVSR